MDPLSGTPWGAPSTVEGFVRAAPNAVLMEYAAQAYRAGGRLLVDIGCGAGRNAVPLAAQGWHVLGTDLSAPMLAAAGGRTRTLDARLRLHLAMAPMESLPVRSRCADFVVAHGIWNLARSDDQFRAAVREAARIARANARLFVFTFSRHTLPPDARPVEGTRFVFTQFSGAPQCFLTSDDLIAELAAAGFTRDAAIPLSEYNQPKPGQLCGGGPVIYEAALVATGTGAGNR